MSERRGVITAEGERLPPRPHELLYLATDPPGTGEARTIADGVLWLRIPLPMELNHINVWLLEDGDGWMLVDTGMAEDVCRDAWLVLEERVLDGRGLKRIFITHDHPDHMGLSPWLAERHGAAVWMSEYAHRSARAFLSADPEAIAARMQEFLRSHGIAVSDGPATGRGSHRRWFGGMPPLAASPSDGESIEAGRGRWRVVETAGHCRGHLCLHDAERRLLISGDQVLPSISPNVSVISSTPRRTRCGSSWLPSNGSASAMRTRWCCRRMGGRFAACIGASRTWPGITSSNLRPCSRSAPSRALRSRCCPRCSGACRPDSIACWRWARRSRTSIACAGAVRWSGCGMKPASCAS